MDDRGVEQTSTARLNRSVAGLPPRLGAAAASHHHDGDDSTEAVAPRLDAEAEERVEREELRHG